MEKWITTSDAKFKYMMLDRLRQDCEYYLGYGNKSTNSLWAESVEEQIQVMKDIWSTFPDEDKPEWLTWNDILEYEARMIGVAQHG